MRGAHSDVWCSKGTSLMEAELFAGQGERPAPSGRALLCAANYAKGNSGHNSVPKSARRGTEAPVSPVSLHISDVSAQRKVRGVKRGRKPYLVSCPFVSAARRRLSLPPKAAIIVYTCSEIRYNETNSPADGGVGHAKSKMEPEHDLHIRAFAGEPAPDLALRAHDRRRPPMGYGKTTAVSGSSPNAPAPRRFPSSASASIPPTLPSSGGACRTPSPAPASTCCATTTARPTPRAAACSSRTCATRWQANAPAISSSTISTC